MKKLLVLSCLILLGVGLLGAAPAAGVEDLLRKGNEAFHNRQYQEALDFYEKAAERSSDPGLAAYNQAVAHYQLGHYRQAELHFRRTLEDAASSRRPLALYGLGNSLLMQANKTDIALLKDAIKCFQLCRQDRDLPAEYLGGANHNLELARLLLAQALANPNNPPPNQDGSEKPKDKQNGTDPTQDPDGSNPNDKGDLDPKQGPHKKNDNLDPAAQSKGKIPQRDNPPVIPDDEKLVPIPAEDAARYLQQVTERILQESRQAHESKTGPVPGVKDW